MQQDGQSCEHLARDEQRERHEEDGSGMRIARGGGDGEESEQDETQREREREEGEVGRSTSQRMQALRPPATSLSAPGSRPNEYPTLAVHPKHLVCHQPPAPLLLSPLNHPSQPSALYPLCCTLCTSAHTHSTSKPHAHLAKGGVVRACSRWLCGDGGASMLVVLFVCV